MKEAYQYGIKDANNNYYYVDGDEVKTTSTPTYFIKGVVNWQDIVITDVRGWRKCGFNRSYVDELQIVGDMAKVISSFWAIHGKTGLLYFELRKLNTTTLDYDLLVNNQIDFYTISFDRLQVTVTLIEGGAVGKIADREDDEITIDVDNNAYAKNIQVQPFLIKGSMRFITIHQNANAGGTQGNLAGGALNWFSLVYANEEYTEILEVDTNKPTGYAAEIAPRAYLKGQQIISGATWGSASGSVQNFMFRSTVDLYNVRVQVSLPCFFKNNHGSSNLDVALELWSYNENSVNSWTLERTTGAQTYAPSGQGNYTFEFDETLTDLPANRRLYLLVSGANSSLWEWNWQNEVMIKVDYEYYTSTFNVKGIPFYNVMQEIVETITDGEAKFLSHLLTGNQTYKDGIDCIAGNVMLMSGDSIKGVAGSKIKTSLREMLQIMNTMFCVGMTVYYDTVFAEWVVRVEPKSYFFEAERNGTDNIIATLEKSGEDWQIEEAADLAISEVHIGYPEPDKDDQNSSDDFNTTLKMSTTSDYGDTMDLTCNVTTAGGQIYRTWVKYASDPRQDSADNNTLFALQAHNNNGWKALYPADMNSGAYVTGLTDNTNVLNIGLSPMRCLIRHAYWLLSHFYDISGSNEPFKFTYRGVDRNDGLISQISALGGAIYEKTDVYIDALVAIYKQERLFYPIRLTLPIDSPENYRELSDANPFGVYKAVLGDKNIFAYPMETVERSIEPRTVEFKLLLTAGNDVVDIMKSSIFKYSNS